MNVFDAVIIAAAVIAIVMGYRSGLLRSLATIFGYLAAAPVALVLTPKFTPHVPATASAFGGSGALVFFTLLLIIGMLLAALLRRSVDAAGGSHGPGV